MNYRDLNMVEIDELAEHEEETYELVVDRLPTNKDYEAEFKPTKKATPKMANWLDLTRFNGQHVHGVKYSPFACVARALNEMLNKDTYTSIE